MATERLSFVSMRSIDDPHSTFAELLLDAIFAELRAGSELVRTHGEVIFAQECWDGGSADQDSEPSAGIPETAAAYLAA